MRKLLVILGAPIDDINMAEALERIEAFIKIGRAYQKGHQIATINADFVVKSLYDAEFRRILQETDMATADGMPLVWGARLLGVPLQGRVTGADMVPALAELAARRGYSIYFLGAAPGVAEQAVAILRQRHPTLRVAGISSPPAHAISSGDPALIDACRAAKPDILLVAFGSPKQEKWIYSHAHLLNIPVMMGVGGTFDFIAGVTKRAPRWMQETGLEWLYRLACEPRRLWKRYATDLIGFGYFFLWQWWIMRRRSPTASLLPTGDFFIVKDTVIMNVRGRLESSNQQAFVEKANENLQMNPYLIVNLAEADFLDSAAIGTLVALTKQARDRGGNLWLANVPAPIVRVLAILRLEQFFDICDDIDSALQTRTSYSRVSVPA